MSYRKGDRVRVVQVPKEGNWPMEVGNTGTVVQHQHSCLPYIWVDLDLKRRGVIVLECELEAIA